MKIIVKRGDDVQNIYHHPKDIIIKPKMKQLLILGSNGDVIKDVTYREKNLTWLEDKNNDNSEVMVEIII